MPQQVALEAGGIRLAGFAQRRRQAGMRTASHPDVCRVYDVGDVHCHVF